MSLCVGQKLCDDWFYKKVGKFKFMISDHKDYQMWLEKQYGVSPTVFLDNLGDWLKEQCRNKLDSNVREGLARCEKDGDPGGFMRLLAPHRNQLGHTISGILYHRWIRLLTLNLLPIEDRKIVENIAIAYMPYHPLPEAFISATPRGHVVCFSETHSYVLLTLFQTITYVSPVTRIVSPEMSIQEEDLLDRIIDLARMFTGGQPLSNINPLGLNESLIHLSDLIHNALQVFVMCHEFGHFLLGHLNAEKPPKTPPLQSETSQKKITHYDDPKERDADEFAARLMKVRVNDKNKINENTLLFSSIIIYFYFTTLCRLTMGFELETLEAQLNRGYRIGEFIFDDSSQIHLLKEVETMVKATDKYLSNRN